jgi:hypothetical protein
MAVVCNALKIARDKEKVDAGFYLLWVLLYTVLNRENYLPVDSIYLIIDSTDLTCPLRGLTI